MRVTSQSSRPHFPCKKSRMAQADIPQANMSKNSQIRPSVSCGQKNRVSHACITSKETFRRAMGHEINQGTSSIGAEDCQCPHCALDNFSKWLGRNWGKDREVKGYNGNTQLWNNALRKRKGKEGKEGKEWWGMKAFKWVFWSVQKCGRSTYKLGFISFS